MPPGDDEHVRRRGRVDVAEGEGVLGLGDDVGRDLARDDAAEEAVLAGGGAHAPNLDAPAVGGLCHDARMTTDHHDTDAFRGATFRRVDLSGASLREVDLSGATIRDSDVRGLRIVASMVDEVVINGHEGVGRVVVDDVEVTAYVAPSSTAATRAGAGARDATADEVRAGLGRRRPAVGRRAGARRHLPEPLLDERVEGEWSFVETMRHLVFAVRHLGRPDAERRARRLPPARGCHPPTPPTTAPPRWA